MRHPGVQLAACFLLAACGPPPDEETVEPESSHPSDWEPGDPDLAAGRATYLAECALCHEEGEEGAPALAERDQWQRRSSKDLAVLFDHAINGFIGEDGEMPARGGTETLGDDEVKRAVRYMLAASIR